MNLKLDWSEWLSDDLWLVVCCIPHNSMTNHLRNSMRATSLNILSSCFIALTTPVAMVLKSESACLMHFGRHTFTHSHSSESRRSELSVRLIRVCLHLMLLKSNDLFIHSLWDVNIVVSTDFNLSSRCCSLQDSKIPLISETKLNFTCSFDITVRCTM